MNRAITFSKLGRLTTLTRALQRDRSGMALVEFAYALPFLTALGLYGGEIANYATVKTRINQTALALADNASRIGENGVIKDIKIYESDINDILTGASYSASDLNLATRGRIIISSLTQNSSGGQWIQWQRCGGSLNYVSSYGKEDDGKTGTGFAGMGAPGKEIKSAANTAVIFVEIAYTYRPLFTTKWLPGPAQITAVGTFNVRDDRDLTQVYQQNGIAPSKCPWNP